jgi:hypothetical protein
LLVSWCASDRCVMASSDKDRGSSRRPSAEDRGWSTVDRVLGGRMIKRLGDAVCGLHRAQGDDERRFLAFASKPRLMFSPDLASNPVASSFPVWASKPTATVW